MKNKVEMVLFSRRFLTEQAARAQIAALSAFDGGLMRPDRCSEAEPIRTPFDPSDMGEAVRWLAKPHGEFFYTKGRPISVSGEMWNREHRSTARFPSPLFLNYWTGRFDGKWANRIGIDRLTCFVSAMFEASGSDFALLTAEGDTKAKNTSGGSVSYKGMDLSAGIPGLYWMNFFGKGFAAWLGLESFPKELAEVIELPGGGTCLRFCEFPEQCRDFDVLQRQRTAIEWLGPERFFDIRFPDRKLQAPDWERIPPPES